MEDVTLRLSLRQMRRKPARSSRRRSGRAIEESCHCRPISGFSAEVGSEVVQLEPSDLEGRGFVTVSDAIRTLPQVFGGGPTEDTTVGIEAART